jgi:hypothetical protein
MSNVKKASEIKNDFIETLKLKLGSHKIEKHENVYAIEGKLRFLLSYSRFYPDSKPPTYWFEPSENTISKLNKDNDYFLFLCGVDTDQPSSMIYLIPRSFIMSDKVEFVKGRNINAQKINIDEVSRDQWIIRQDKLKRDLSGFRSSIQEIVAKISDYSISKRGIEKSFQEPQKGLTNEPINPINEESKEDAVSARLKAIEEALQEIKNQSEKNKSDIEEKLKSMYEGISKVIDEWKKNISLEQYNQYLIKVKNLFEFWNKLDNKTQQMLSDAEYLYENLQKTELKEYSLVILQYCKCLENELSAKIFLVFMESNKRFKQELNKCTFGEMIRYLQQLSSENLKNQEPLYKELKNFLRKNFNIDRLLSNHFLDELESINKDYRTKSAHVYSMNIKDAQNCRDIVILTLDDFMGFISLT